MDTLSALTFLDSLSEEEFVLHGSPDSHRYLVPSAPDQGHLIPEYNRMAVYGTGLVEIAVLYALIRTSSLDWGWRFVDDPFHPYILVVGPERLYIDTGYIHLVKRPAFTDCVLGGLTYLAYSKVKAEQEVPVYADMLENLIEQRRIAVLSYEEYSRKYM